MLRFSSSHQPDSDPKGALGLERLDPGLRFTSFTKKGLQRKRKEKTTQAVKATPTLIKEKGKGKGKGYTAISASEGS